MAKLLLKGFWKLQNLMFEKTTWLLICRWLWLGRLGSDLMSTTSISPSCGGSISLRLETATKTSSFAQSLNSTSRKTIKVRKSSKAQRSKRRTTKPHYTILTTTIGESSTQSTRKISALKCLTLTWCLRQEPTRFWWAKRLWTFISTTERSDLVKWVTSRSAICFAYSTFCWNTIRITSLNFPRP